MYHGLIQRIYDHRDQYADVSGNDLHEAFSAWLGDPSPSGYRRIGDDDIRRLVAIVQDGNRHMTDPNRDHLGCPREWPGSVFALPVVATLTDTLFQYREDLQTYREWGKSAYGDDEPLTILEREL